MKTNRVRMYSIIELVNSEGVILEKIQTRPVEYDSLAAVFGLEIDEAESFAVGIDPNEIESTIRQMYENDQLTLSDIINKEAGLDLLMHDEGTAGADSDTQALLSAKWEVDEEEEKSASVEALDQEDLSEGKVSSVDDFLSNIFDGAPEPKEEEEDVLSEDVSSADLSSFLQGDQSMDLEDVSLEGAQKRKERADFENFRKDRLNELGESEE